jgi:hypothetical protein
MTEEEIVAAVLRMRPAVRRRVLARLLRASSAAARGLVATPRRRCRSADDELREALAASAGILKLDEDPVDWQRRIRAEWDDR